MNGIPPTLLSCSQAPGSRQGGPHGMRTDLDTMLMPFFPEDGGVEAFSTTIDGYTITMSSAVPGQRIATAVDRKVLNLLGARIGEMIRSGVTPSRRVEIGVRDLLEAIAGDTVIGGSRIATYRFLLGAASDSDAIASNQNPRRDYCGVLSLLCMGASECAAELAVESRHPYAP